MIYRCNLILLFSLLFCSCWSTKKIQKSRIKLIEHSFRAENVNGKWVNRHYKISNNFKDQNLKLVDSLYNLYPTSTSEVNLSLNGNVIIYGPKGVKVYVQKSIVNLKTDNLQGSYSINIPDLDNLELRINYLFDNSISEISLVKVDRELDLKGKPSSTYTHLFFNDSVKFNRNQLGQILSFGEDCHMILYFNSSNLLEKIETYDSIGNGYGIEIFENMFIKAYGKFTKYKKDDEWQLFHQNGNLSEVRNYDRGNQVSILRFYQNGEPVSNAKD